MSKFKIGDRVRVVRDYGDNEGFLGGTAIIVELLFPWNQYTGYFDGAFIQMEGREYPGFGPPGDLALLAELELKP